jgi:hypothetical protein
MPRTIVISPGTLADSDAIYGPLGSGDLEQVFGYLMAGRDRNNPPLQAVGPPAILASFHLLPQTCYSV